MPATKTPQRRTIDLEAITLSAGSHEPDGQFCVMELSAYIAGEGWSDQPTCVSAVIASFLRSWNDGLDDEARQLLKPYALTAIGTNTGAADDETRAWMATDWLARVHTPAWLRLAGLTKEAEALEQLARIVDAETAKSAQPALDRARSASAAAWDAASAAAWDAARDAAWAAASAAASSAARAAAWAAARAAAWAAARDAARDAAWAAARDALAPTALALRQSAFELLDAMIAVGKKAA